MLQLILSTHTVLYQSLEWAVSFYPYFQGVFIRGEEFIQEKRLLCNLGVLTWTEVVIWSGVFKPSENLVIVIRVGNYFQTGS